nr:ATP synthase F0 subunit 8 [Cryptonema producta]UYR95080.1 ATP synthase subunit 8 [Cryptonema producta]
MLWLMKLAVPQFAPMFFGLVFFMIWMDYLSKFCLLWWSGKRSYNF